MTLALLQLQIEDESLLKKIIRTHHTMDCVVCALEYLQIIPRTMTPMLRTIAVKRGLYVPEILAVLNYLYPAMNTELHRISDLIGNLNVYLLPGHATIVGIDYTDGTVVMGHVMIIGRHKKDQNIFLMDSKTYIKGTPAILGYLQNIHALPIFTTFMWELRSSKTPSPFIRSEMERTIKTVQTIRAQYTESVLLEIPGLNSNKMRRLRACHDIPTFLFIMDVIDSRTRRFLLSLPLTSITAVRDLFVYLFDLTYEPTATAQGKVAIREGSATLAFDQQVFGRFWYVGCHNGVVRAVDPNNDERTSSQNIVYVLVPSPMEEGQIR